MKKRLVIFIILVLFFGSFAVSTFPDKANAIEEIAPYLISKIVAAATSQDHESTKGCFETVGSIPVGINVEACMAEGANVLLGIMARVLWVAGIVMNAAIGLTIRMSEMLEMVPVVEIGWTIFRDLANILFIFILLYIAIRTILFGTGLNDKQILSRLVVVALLINFSLFITSVIVDASNIVAVHFYNEIPGAGNVNINSTATDLDNGISASIMNGLKMQSIYDSEQIGAGPLISNLEQDVINFSKVVTVGILGSIVILIVAFIFFAAAIMFIIRLVTLMFLMLVSPLAFVSMILPGTQKMSRKWWDQLFKEAFFAPIFLVFLFIIVNTLNHPEFKKIMSIGGEEATWSAAFTGTGTGPVVIVFNFLLVIGLLVAALLMSKSFSSYGSEWIGKSGDNITKWGKELVTRPLRGAGAVAVSAGGTIARTAIGGVASSADKALGKGRFGNNALGYGLRKVTTKPLIEAKFGTTQSTKDIEKERKERLANLRNIDTRDYIRSAGDTSVPPPLDLPQRLAGMSGKQLETVGANDVINDNIIEHMTKAQYDAIMKNTDPDKGAWSDEEKSRLRETRLNMVRRDTVTRAPGETDGEYNARVDRARRVMNTMNGEDFLTLEENDFTDELISHLRSEQLKKMDNLRREVRERIGTEIRVQNLLGGHRAYGYVNGNEGSSIYPNRP